MLTRERHGDGPEHYSSSVNGFVFELYPLATGSRATTSIRIGFSVDSVDQLVPSLRALGAGLVTEVHDSPWGRRAVVRDLDGHSVELLTPHSHSPALSPTLTIDPPPDLAHLRLPVVVAARLKALLDRQDAGNPLTLDERVEAEGLADLANLLTLLRQRAEQGAV